MTTNSMTKTYSLPTLGKLFLAVAMLVGVFTPAALALTPISQGYSSSGTLTPGSIVSLKDNSADQVDATTSKNISTLLGVIISSDNSLLSLSNGQANQVQVATSGTVQTLVSDMNGDIKQGDQVTASPIGGIGMKATDSVKVIGIAQADLTKSNSSTHNYTDKSGAKQSVHIGQVPVLVNVAYYYKAPTKTLIPAGVQNIANALAGKNVNPTPILVCMGIFIITLIVVVSIIYSMIRSSIISVGRNPMSQSAIYRDMLQMSALVVGILAVSMVAMYMILTRF